MQNTGGLSQLQTRQQVVNVPTRAIDYLNKADKSMVGKGVNTNAAWTREKGITGAKEGKFFAAFHTRDSNGKKKHSPKKGLSSFPNDVWLNSETQDVLALSWINPERFAKTFKLTEEGLGAYSEGFPVFVFDKLSNIRVALKTVGLFPASASDDLIDAIIADAAFKKGDITATRSEGRGRATTLEADPRMSDDKKYWFSKLVDVSNVAKKKAEEEKGAVVKVQWTAEKLDELMRAASNLGTGVVVDVNGNNIGYYGSALKRPIENVLIDRINTIAKKADGDGEKANDHRINISDYLAGSVEVSTGRPERGTSERAAAQPVPYGLRWGQFTFTPGFITSDNVEALAALYAMGNNGSSPLGELTLGTIEFVDSTGARVGETEAVSALRSKLEASRKVRQNMNLKATQGEILPAKI